MSFIRLVRLASECEWSILKKNSGLALSLVCQDSLTFAVVIQSLRSLSKIPQLMSTSVDPFNFGIFGLIGRVISFATVVTD